MYTVPTRIHVDPDSELARLLENAADTPLLLEKDGKLYRLMEETTDEAWARYDPDEAIAAFEETAGSWADIDADTLIADIYRAREEGSRPTTRP